MSDSDLERALENNDDFVVPAPAFLQHDHQPATVSRREESLDLVQLSSDHDLRSTDNGEDFPDDAREDLVEASVVLAPAAAA